MNATTLAVITLVFLALSRFGPTALTQAIATKAKVTPRTVKLIMRVLVTVVVGYIAIGIIRSPTHDPEADKWAYGILGTLVGHWFSGSV